MAPKRATFISYGGSQDCLEVRNFIEGSGIVLTVRDLSQKPFTERELSNLVGYLNMDHFVDKTSESFHKNGLDKGLPERDEMIKMMAEDYTLIRRPIIKSNRLITVGCDKKKLMDMLQISESGELIYVQPPRQIGNSSHSNHSNHHKKKKVTAGSGR